MELVTDVGARISRERGLDERERRIAGGPVGEGLERLPRGGGRQWSGQLGQSVRGGGPEEGELEQRLLALDELVEQGMAESELTAHIGHQGPAVALLREDLPSCFGDVGEPVRRRDPGHGVTL